MSRKSNTWDWVLAAIFVVTFVAFLGLSVPSLDSIRQATPEELLP